MATNAPKTAQDFGFMRALSPEPKGVLRVFSAGLRGVRAVRVGVQDFSVWIAEPKDLEHKDLYIVVRVGLSFGDGFARGSLGFCFLV